MSIIGMRNGSRYEEVNITCLHVSSSSYHWLGYIVFQCVSLYNCNNVPVSCTQPSFDLTTHNAISQEVCPVCSNLTLSVKFINLHLKHRHDKYVNVNLQFKVSILDNCKNEQYDSKNDLFVCVVTAHSNYICSNVPIQSYCYAAYDDLCYKYSNSINPFKESLCIQTVGLINMNITVNVTEFQCKTCKGKYLIPVTDKYYYDNDNNCYGDDGSCNDYDYCYDECKRQCYTN